MIENIVKKNHTIKSFDVTTQNKFSYIVMPGLFVKRVLMLWTLFKKKFEKDLIIRLMIN